MANLLRAEVAATEKINDTDTIWQRETLTDGFLGLNDRLADSGIEIGLGVINIYQQNVRGGISTHRRAGRFAGSYDLELSADFDKLFGTSRRPSPMLRPMSGKPALIPRFTRRIISFIFLKRGLPRSWIQKKALYRGLIV